MGNDPPYPCGGRSADRLTLDRRKFLAGLAVGAAGGGVLSWGATQLLRSAPLVALEEAKVAIPDGPLGIPGPYPGRVIEVHHPGGARGNRRNHEAVAAMVARGMSELVGVDNATEAWRKFFSPGDRVGIKVVPVGKPDSISSPEVVQEVVAGLVSAGVKKQDILLFDRYENEFAACGYDELADALGVHWECESVRVDGAQTRLDGQLLDQSRSKRASGYDRDVFRMLPFCGPDHDPQDDRSYRSHLSMIISQKIDKYIGIPVLKDHRSAGVTLALKNLSHGSVNNVARSHTTFWNPNVERYHPGMAINQCSTFIPAIVTLEKIRRKAVLQIGDGLVGTYEGGPGAWCPTFKTWNANSLLFATDPVAMDHVGWQIIDEKRSTMGWPSVATMGLEANRGQKPSQLSEQFQLRQPDHIFLAATMGLGIFERDQIEHRRVVLS